MYDNVIKYVGFYSSNSKINENRNYVLSATNKMDYIIKVLNKIDYKVEIVSPSWTNDRKFYKKKKVKINQINSLTLFSTLPWGSNLTKLSSVIYSFFCMVLYLLRNCNRNETLIVYHSKWMTVPIIVLRMIKPSLSIILEVEEIYSDIKKSFFWEKMESIVFNNADKYLFPTQTLCEKINTEKKPYSIVHGNYEINEISSKKFGDEKIHVVYAGTFNQIKGGAKMAIKTALYLPENYHVHIIGFGTTRETKEVLQLIKDTEKHIKGTLTYDGLLTGNEYNSFLQSCDIGLSTQNPEAAYNETSFPSKLLSYLSNNLKVVTIKIKVIERSAVKDLLYYYENHNPKEIANTIIKVDLTDKNKSHRMLKKLDDEFTISLSKLVKE